MDHENKENTLGQATCAQKKQVEVITPKWISVVDQLPPEYVTVIVRASYGDGKGENCFIFEAKYKEGKYLDDNRAKLEVLKRMIATMEGKADEDFEELPEDKEYSAQNWVTSIPFWNAEDTAYTLLIDAITHWAPLPILEEE